MMPIANNGSMFIYQKIIRPFVVKHEKTLDAAFDSATQLAKDAGKSGRQHLRAHTLGLCVGGVG